ncbi:MAG: hypothetical protein K2O24_03560 [Muribaculaceae bacterium]|nr:hypothetical protein [Muribaculaceae bacterium]
MSRVVYLLGAGASYGKRSEITLQTYKGLSPTGKYSIDEGIPVVNEINREIDMLVKSLKEIDPDYQTEGNFVGSFIKDLVWLKKEAERHMTIDTLAKQLFLQENHTEFDRLKRILSAFFIMMQVIYPADKRYDAFLANVLTYPAKRIPDDITILTWNYDSQIEIAYREYNPTTNPSEDFWRNVRKQLGITESHDFETSNGKIYKLNGSAMLEYYGSFTRIGNPYVTDKKEFVSKLSGIYHMSTSECYLRFAWEVDDDCRYLKDVFAQIQDAEVLVVIGYTFPYFNRKIDRALFNNMPNLRKIYIQDPMAERVSQNMTPVLSGYQADGNIPIILLKDVDQFYLPSEL